MQNRLFWIFSFFSLRLSAQTAITILPPNGRTLDSIRYYTHVVVNKMPGDSAWMVYQYDAQNAVMTIGTYKDEKLTIPHGRFKYYRYSSPSLQVTYNYTLHKADSVMVPAQNNLVNTGYFVNGEKAGRWVTFAPLGKILFTETYEHGKLNGPSESYNISTGKVLIAGNYIEGMREGKWNMLSFDGDTLSTDIYKHNKVVKTISYLDNKKFKLQEVKSAQSPYNFVHYLNTKLSKKGVSKSGTKKSLYMFSVDSLGHIIKPEVMPNGSINAGLDIQINTAVIDAILTAPAWLPGSQNKKPITVFTSIELNVEFDEKGIHVSEVTYPGNDARKNIADRFNSLEPGKVSN